MVSAVLWMLFSLGTSIFRGYTLHLLDRDVKINWIPSFSGDNDRLIFTRIFTHALITPHWRVL